MAAPLKKSKYENMASQCFKLAKNMFLVKISWKDYHGQTNTQNNVPKINKYMTSPSKNDEMGVHKLEWKCAICTIKGLCRLHTFTVNYVHADHRFCKVRLHICRWMMQWAGKTFAV